MSYNSTGETKFLIYLPRGEVRSFTQCEMGLFYSKMAAGGGALLLNTVEHTKSKYSDSYYTRYLLARKIQYKIVLTIQRHLVNIMENEVQMLNFPLT